MIWQVYSTFKSAPTKIEAKDDEDLEAKVRKYTDRLGLFPAEVEFEGYTDQLDVFVLEAYRFKSGWRTRRRKIMSLMAAG